MSDERTRFANVVLPHLGDAYALARWLTRNDSDAEDIVQEACLRAFRGITGFGDVNARAWVLSIVRNTAFTWLKKHRDPRLVAVENIELVEAPGPEQDGGPFAGPSSPEASLIERADAARLEAAIGALPERIPRDPGAARRAGPRLSRHRGGHRRADRDRDVAARACPPPADGAVGKGHGMTQSGRPISARACLLRRRARPRQRARASSAGWRRSRSSRPSATASRP